MEFLEKLAPAIIWLVILYLGRSRKKKKAEASARRAATKPPAQVKPKPVQAAARGNAPSAPVATTLSQQPEQPRAQRTGRGRTRQGRGRGARDGTPQAAPMVPSMDMSRLLQGAAVLGLRKVLGTEFFSEPLLRELEGSTARIRGPESLVMWTDHVAARLLEIRPMFHGELNMVTRSVVGNQEFSAATLEQFLARSSRLSAAWIEGLFADALGLLMFGPPWADWRMQQFTNRHDRSVVRLSMAGSQGQLQVPMGVRFWTLKATLGSLGFKGEPERGWPVPDPEVIFDLGGMQQIPVAADGLVSTSLEMNSRMLTHEWGVWGGRTLLSVWRNHPLTGQWGQLESAAAAIRKGGRPAVPSVLKPQLLMMLHRERPEVAWDGILEQLPAPSAYAEVPRSAAVRSRAGAIDRESLIQGIMLVEVLGDNLRPGGRRAVRG